MLRCSKKITPKTVSGKKYRSPFFIVNLIVLVVLFFVSLIWTSIDLPEREGRGVIIGLICVLTCAIPFALVLGSRRAVFVLGEDAFYFFGAEVERHKGPTRKSKSTATASGSFLYTDVVKTEYKRASYNWWTEMLTPPCVTLHGADFSVTVAARRWLMAEIEQRKQAATGVPLETEEEEGERLPGLFGEIVLAFDRGAFEDMWGEGVTLDSCEREEELHTVDIAVIADGKTVYFNIDKESVYAVCPDTEREETVPLTNFADVDSLLAYMQSRVHSLR